MSVASARTSGGTRASGWAQSRQINCGRQMRHCIAKKRKVEKNLVATSNHTACNMVKEFRNIQKQHPQHSKNNTPQTSRSIFANITTWEKSWRNINSCYGLHGVEFRNIQKQHLQH
jgi:hypothetical protein